MGIEAVKQVECRVQTDIERVAVGRHDPRLLPPFGMARMEERASEYQPPHPGEPAKELVRERARRGPPLILLPILFPFLHFPDRVETAHSHFHRYVTDPLPVHLFVRLVQQVIPLLPWTPCTSQLEVAYVVLPLVSRLLRPRLVVLLLRLAL